MSAHSRDKDVDLNKRIIRVRACVRACMRGGADVRCMYFSILRGQRSGGIDVSLIGCFSLEVPITSLRQHV